MHRKPDGEQNLLQKPGSAHLRWEGAGRTRCIFLCCGYTVFTYVKIHHTAMSNALDE